MKRKRGRPKGSKNKKKIEAGVFKNGNRVYKKRSVEDKIKSELLKYTKKKRHELEWLWKITSIAKKYKKTWKFVIDDNIEILKNNCNIDLVIEIFEWRTKPEVPIFNISVISKYDIWKGNTVSKFLEDNNIFDVYLTKPYDQNIRVNDDIFLFRIKQKKGDDWFYIYILTNDMKKVRKKINLSKI